MFLTQFMKNKIIIEKKLKLYYKIRVIYKK